MISNENQKLLKILSNALHMKKCESLDEKEWKIISDELKNQAVYAIPTDYLDFTNINQTEKIKQLQLTAKNIQRFHLIMSEQQKMLSVLEAADISAVILKGVSAAIYYTVPEYRCMGDIDIIVQPDDFEKAYTTLKDKGYQTKESPDNYHRHIKFKSPKGIPIELHNYFSTSSNKKQNDILDNFVYKGIEKKISIQLKNYSASILPTVENGLVLLAHINQHLGTGLGLRQIIDWMCFVEKNLTDELWYNDFSYKAEQIGMKKLAIATTAMCKCYLGLNADITWYKELENDSICDDLIEYILERGNFGKKDSQGGAAITVLRSVKNPIKGIAYMQRTGCVTWKTLKKHKWLKPFAWLYQLTRWLIHGKEKGISISTIKEQSKKEHNETELLKKLETTMM